MEKIVDWVKWMEQHHIKLGGNPDDNRANADDCDGNVQERPLEEKSGSDAGQSGSSNIFNDEKKWLPETIVYNGEAPRTRYPAGCTDEHI